MTKLDLKTVIRRIVREEIYKELPDILVEVIGDMFPTNPKLLLKKPPIKKTINEETIMSKEQVRAMLRSSIQLEGGGFHMTSDDVPMPMAPPAVGISAEAYEQMMNMGMSELPVTSMPVSAVKDPALARALTRNYSDLMKRLK